MPKYIDAKKFLEDNAYFADRDFINPKYCDTLRDLVEAAPAANVYTAHEVAVLMAELIGDDCACNVNGNDEWLPVYCEFRETVCPNPCGVTCWEQWLKWRQKKGDDVG